MGPLKNNPSPEQIMIKPKYPAIADVHWSTGPVPCCEIHMQGLINLGNMLGVHVIATKLTEEKECTNCLNEHKNDE